MWILLTVLISLVILVAVLMFIQAEDFERDIDFQQNILNRKRNQFLLAPANFSKDKPHQTAPQYDLPATQLAEIFASTVLKEQRISKIDSGENRLRQRYKQKSRTFHFPDQIEVEFIALSANKSSLAIYSRSKYGQGDLGVNKARVNRWLKKLETQTKAQADVY